MSWLITLVSAGLKLWSWISDRQKQQVGALKQQVADDEATRKAETDAAGAARRADSDPGYAGRVRDRYTDRSGG